MYIYIYVNIDTYVYLDTYSEIWNLFLDSNVRQYERNCAAFLVIQTKTSIRPDFAQFKVLDFYDLPKLWTSL